MEDLKSRIPETIDAYMAGYPEEIQEKMCEVRKIIHDVIPEVTEKISWGMATFQLNKKNMIHFAGQKNHLGIYPGAEAIAAYTNELTGFKSTKGGVQFPYNKPIPVELLIKLIRYRAQEIRK